MLESSQRHRGCTMQTVFARWVLLFSLLLSSVCTLAHAADQTITRTVEHFTLGMPKDQAFAVLLSGIKQHHFTLVDTAQTPSPELYGALGAHPYRRCWATLERTAECGRPLYAQCPPL